jgi:hypothetical protein
MSSSSETLFARVTRLERSSRRDRAIVLGVIVVAVLTAQTSAPQGNVSPTPIVVRDASGMSAMLGASGLTVRDASGKVRLFAGVDDQGRPSLDERDSTGALRQSMYLFDQQPTLRQFDALGKRRLELKLNTRDSGEVRLTDANENLRGAFFVAASGNPQVGLYGTDEKLRAFFSTDEQSPYLVMRDATGANRVNIGGFADGSIGMDIRNASNTVLWKAP